MSVGLGGLKVALIHPYGVPLPDTVTLSASYPSADEADFDGTPGVGGASQWKQPVRCATTASVTIATALNAGDTIDGVTLVAGDRVLVKNQSTASQNGIYIVDATPYRAGDMDDDTEVLGAVVYVSAGTANAGTAWRVTNTAATVVDTDAINWAAFGGLTSVALDDLTDVVITSAANADRLRYNSATAHWEDSPLVWEPMIATDGTVMTDGLLNPMQHEVPY